MSKLEAKEPEFAKACRQGLMMEVLDWRTVIEEPRAAVLICNALNRKNSLALQTNELSALSVLMTTVSSFAEQSLNHDLAYTHVKDTVSRELKGCVDNDADFKEALQFVVDQGANQSEHLHELLQFGEQFVGPKASLFFSLIN